MKLGMGNNKQKEAFAEKILEAGGPAFSVLLAHPEDARSDSDEFIYSKS